MLQAVDDPCNFLLYEAYENEEAAAAHKSTGHYLALRDWFRLPKVVRLNLIKPVLEAAREAGVAVFRLAQSTYAPNYPQYLTIENDPELRSPVPKVFFVSSD